jgi:hypothetical protein
MKMNAKMSALLAQFDSSIPSSIANWDQLGEPQLTEVGDSVLLKDQLKSTAHVTLADFQDRTGYECFINHVHVPFDTTRESLQASVEFASRLRSELALIAKGRPFLVILAISGKHCPVRFHQRRPNEVWLDDDLEEYVEEAILVLPVGVDELPPAWRRREVDEATAKESFTSDVVRGMATADH